jgi:diadenylate cyclase
VSGILEGFQTYIGWTFSQFSWNDLADIALVTIMFYAVLYAIRGTQAVQMLRGLILVTFFAILVTPIVLDEFTAFRWLISKTLTALLVAIPVILQPELRRALERLGRAVQGMRLSSAQSMTRVVTGISRAAGELSERQYGALIVVEQMTGLQNIAETGIKMDAMISSDLLVSIFYPKTPLHDGAVIVRDDRIIAAAAVLPLSEHPLTDRKRGTRHLAAIGVTEGTDAIAVVVSEETGSISVARHGRLVRIADEGKLYSLLAQWLAKPKRRITGITDLFGRRRAPLALNGNREPEQETETPDEEMLPEGPAIVVEGE